MLDTVRVYIEATVAVAIMAVVSILAGFVAGAITGDRQVVLTTIAAMFVLSGAVVVFRFWKTTRKPALPLNTEN